MKQLTAIVTLLASLAITPCSFSKAILWVSDNGVQVAGQGVVYPASAADHIPPLPTFADQVFVDLLISSGYTVDRYRPDSGGLTAFQATVVNRYDLVIVGAATNSGPFALQNRGRPGWNTEVRAPMIVTKSTLIRRDRMGWLLDNKEFDCGADSSTTSSPPPPHPGKQTFYVPSHPVFKGIGSTNQVMNNYSHQRVGVPFTVPGVQNNRGTSMQIFQLFVDGNDVTAANGISNNTIEPGGLVLSSMEFNPLNPSAPLANAPAPGTLPTINVSPNPVYDAAGYAIVEWPAGTVVRSTQVAGEMVAGYRMHFACGTRDPNVAGAGNSPSPQVGSMDLTSDGVGMFLNAVAYAISQGPEFRIITVLRAGSDVTLTWNSHTGDTYTIQQSTDIKDSLSWTDVATGIFGDFGDQTSSIVTAPAGNAPIFYRIKKQ